MLIRLSSPPLHGNCPCQSQRWPLHWQNECSIFSSHLLCQQCLAQLHNPSFLNTFSIWLLRHHSSLFLLIALSLHWGLPFLFLNSGTVVFHLTCTLQPYSRMSTKFCCLGSVPEIWARSPEEEAQVPLCVLKSWKWFYHRARKRTIALHMGMHSPNGLRLFFSSPSTLTS